MGKQEEENLRCLMPNCLYLLPFKRTRVNVIDIRLLSKMRKWVACKHMKINGEYTTNRNYFMCSCPVWLRINSEFDVSLI